MSKPPDFAIEAAAAASRSSPCRKSKRGAVVFHPKDGIVGVPAFNSRPDLRCDDLCWPQSSDAMRWSATLNGSITRCSQMCIHAEARAIRFAQVASVRSEFVADGDFMISLYDCELVHVKIDQGTLVTSGPPSCMWCAKEIADVGLRGVWLFEQTEVGGDYQDEWIFYPTDEFWWRTAVECKIGSDEEIEALKEAFRKERESRTIEMIRRGQL